MLGDITACRQIYIACGYTDMRKSIDGLVALVQNHFEMDPFESARFLFCGRRCDQIKALFWEGDGFLLLCKRLENEKFYPFVTGRKNWLFADTPKGAAASAAVYSLVETARANGLEVFSYLQELLANMTQWDHTDEYPEDLMPWSEFSRSQCRR